jgi:hypothetical protein
MDLILESKTGIGWTSGDDHPVGFGQSSRRLTPWVNGSTGRPQFRRSVISPAREQVDNTAAVKADAP